MITEIIAHKEAQEAAQKAQREEEERAVLRLKNFLLSQVAALLVDEFNEAGYRLREIPPGNGHYSPPRYIVGHDQNTPCVMHHNQATAVLEVRYMCAHSIQSAEEPNGFSVEQARGLLLEKRLHQRARAHKVVEVVRCLDAEGFPKGTGYEYGHLLRTKDPVEVAKAFALNVVRPFFELHKA